MFSMTASISISPRLLLYKCRLLCHSEGCVNQFDSFQTVESSLSWFLRFFYLGCNSTCLRATVPTMFDSFNSYLIPTSHYSSKSSQNVNTVNVLTFLIYFVQYTHEKTIFLESLDAGKNAFVTWLNVDFRCRRQKAYHHVIQRR